MAHQLRAIVGRVTEESGGPPAAIVVTHPASYGAYKIHLLELAILEAGIANAEVVLGRFEDPELPDGGVDLVLTVDTYHHIEDRPSYFRNLKRDLAPGGRVAVIDYDGRKGWFVRLLGHYTPREELLREMREAGYEVVEEHAWIDRQSFVIFGVP